MESTEIHLLNAHPRKRAKITSNQPDIQILPEKNLENMEKDFFMFISAICYSAVASLLLSIC